MTAHTAPTFDRELTFLELLGSLQPARLQTMLSSVLAEPVVLLDAEGKPLLEANTENNPAANTLRTPLRWQLDTVAWLACAAPADQCAAAAALVEQVFLHSARYRMAADLHRETLLDDYEKLQQQHAALQESESRYRDLSAQLEQRVSEQVKTIETSQRKLFNAEKMAAIGQLAAGVAHEINNPIGFILSNLRIAQEYVEQVQHFAATLLNMGDATVARQAWDKADLDAVLEDFPQLLHESVDGASRISKIVADLRTVTDLEQSKEMLSDINQLIRTSCQLGMSRHGSEINLVLQLGELPLTHCYPDQLSQVCLHLLLNATQACVSGTDSKPGVGSEIHIVSQCEQNEIVIQINDNGCGIPADVLPRVFEPFYTTREVGQGTGLGLSVCRDIIQAHGGHIEINSQVGTGTTVELTLPVRPEA